MNCSEVHEFLSAYHDGELSNDQRAQMSEHINACPACAHQLAAFAGISNMTSALVTPEPPQHIWPELKSRLIRQTIDQRPAVASSDPWRGSSRWTAKLFSLAATALVAVGVGWFAYQTWFAHGDHHVFAAEFGQYLSEFQQDPVAAQQILLTKYENQVVDPDTAMQRVGYRPAVADGLPKGYSVESMYVMEMPCCTCVQCLCKRPDGSSFAIFEHDDEETKEWFGDRPESSTDCDGTRCSLVELDSQLAASWKHGQRYITVVGIRDIAELTEVVAWFDGQKQVRTQ